MYEIFEQLLLLHGITSYQVSKATGIATATLSDWKRGRSTPKQDKLQKIADYFQVSLSYLMYGTKEAEETAQQDIVSLVQTVAERKKVRTVLEYALRTEDADLECVIALLKTLDQKTQQIHALTKTGGAQ